jgi:anaerobic selenocysteine-containing dehydrogenase
MTNNWSDIDNASMVYVQGANPAENHPASIAHVNAARFGNKKAELVVIDPRLTRTARLVDPAKGDFYARIRPGTDIAFINGVLNQIFTRMAAAKGNPASPDYALATNFYAWHNGDLFPAVHTSAARTFCDNGGTTRTLSATELATATYDGGATAAFSGGRAWPKYTDSRAKVNTAGTDYQRAVLVTASGWTFNNMPVFAENVDDSDTVFQKLRGHVAQYPLATVAKICECKESDVTTVADKFLKHSRMASTDFSLSAATPTADTYKAATIMYAMGITQHTCGSQNIRDYAIIQSLLGNMGRAGGGINALRGIHNVQGSTDMAVLYDGIPGYSGNPGVGQTYTAYQNSLFGNRVANGTGTTTTNSPYTPANLGLQQRGFYNMTREWFGNRALTAPADIEKLWSCWPKGNGYQHTEAIRRMVTGGIKAAVVWGQNPAVTEPNQKVVRDGLANLDLMVCVDMFANETAQCHRKATGVTYLLPSCSHVEEAGSVSSSGRWIQWRDRARAPKGNSKADLELLFRFSKALNAAGAFSHIQGQWAGTALAGQDPWTVLYAKYGWDGTSDFESISGSDAEGVTLNGNEYVAEQVFKEIASPLNPADLSVQAGTLWIYSGNVNASAYSTDVTNNNPAVAGAPAWSTWDKANRAKSRKGHPDYASASLQYPRYGWAWLLNRRIFYNNGELAGDVADVFVAPGVMARLFTINTNTFADWSLLYRAYNTLADKPDRNTAAGQVHELAGRFPGHTEPYESPKDGTHADTVKNPDLVSTWGYNTKAGARLLFEDGDAVGNPNGYVGTPVGKASGYPLVLTSIRCVEHFQGGPITRNNPWNVELEPEPWIELNSVDALKYGIKDGDYVNITTARSNSTTDQAGRTISAGPLSAGTWNKGFKARVGVGTAANQRVAAGVVAIPWHWGDRGLSTGARANDLCIDAFDANTAIPEYKACLCKIEKVTP